MERRRSSWYVWIDVPPSLRETIGRRRLRKTTGTTDVVLARLKRGAILTELRGRIEAARTQATWGEHGGAMGKALLLKDALAAEKDFNAQQDITLEAVEIAEDIERKQGHEAAKQFYAVATGKATPLTLHLEEWLLERGYRERQQADFRNWVKHLAEWLGTQGHMSTLEAVTDKVASTYKAKALVGAGVHPKTANKKMSGLRSYWKWLEQQGHASRNPWLGKSLPKIRGPRDEEERPFTDEEVVALFTGEPDATLWDAMLIGALSGMRLDEIFQLKVKHCRDGAFRVAFGTTGKTQAAERVVPIHPKLKATIQRLCDGKGEQDYLMPHEGRGWGKSRSMAVSKRFRTYREGRGVDHKLPGKRRSLVNFHSFRRWFITKADQAGCRKEDIERVVGHKTQGMSLGLYSGGITFEQLRAVVEAVRLPKR